MPITRKDVYYRYHNRVRVVLSVFQIFVFLNPLLLRFPRMIVRMKILWSLRSKSVYWWFFKQRVVKQVFSSEQGKSFLISDLSVASQLSAHCLLSIFEVPNLSLSPLINSFTKLSISSAKSAIPSFASLPEAFSLSSAHCCPCLPPSRFPRCSKRPHRSSPSSMASFLVRTLPIPSPSAPPSTSRPSLPVNLPFSPSSESIRTTSLPNPIAFTLIGDSARPRARSSGPKTSFSLRLFHSSRCSPSNWLFATIKCQSQLFWITWRGFSSCPE